MEKGILTKNNNGDWLIRYQKRDFHAGISKLGTGPGVGKKIYEEVDLPIHPDCILVMHESCFLGTEVEFKIKVDCIEECYGQCFECNSLKKYAVIINSKGEIRNDEWDIIGMQYVEIAFGQKDTKMKMDFLEWLKKNYNPPTKK